MPSVTRKLGAILEIDGEKEYKDALKSLNLENRVLTAEMKKLQAEYKGNTDSAEYLTKAGEQLGKALQVQQEKVATIRKRLEEYANAGEEAKDETLRLQAALLRAETEEINLQHAIDENNAALQDQGEEMVGLGDTVDQLASKLGIHLPEGAKTALNGMEGFSAGTVAAMAAAAAAVAALIAVFKELNDITLQVAADADEYLTQSAITSVPVEMLQAWDYAAQFVDVSADTITGSMTKITRAMSDAKDGSGESAEAFAALGISVTDADGQLRSAHDVFLEAIDALGTIENQTERDAVAMSLMGKSAQELNPLINAGSEALDQYAKEAEELGYVLDKDQIEKLAEVDDAYQKTQLAVESLKKQIAVDFAPASKEAMELFSSVVQKAGEFLKRSGLIENLGSMFASLIDILETLGEFVSALPSVGQGLDGMNTALKEVAFTFALIADTIKAIVGLMPTMWGSGMLKQALGFDAKNGNYSNLQRINGTAATMEAQRNGYRGNGGEDMSGYGYDPSSGMYYDLTTGNYIFGHNATGNDNWRGGLTWVGENGPELWSLPQGSQIYSAQESRNMGGDTFYITIDAASVKEFNDIVELAQSARVRQRMR